ncbi:MAG: hypothetical protein KDK96_10995 [Chlamydiia bacterium]|nr:hypothetical protein [Simkania sp.]MCB1073606.1 hypothetical protein [Chlamydiia bacterium]
MSNNFNPTDSKVSGILHRKSFTLRLEAELLDKIKKDVEYQKRNLNYSMTVQQWIVEAILNKVNNKRRREVIKMFSSGQKVVPFPIRLDQNLLNTIEQDILSLSPTRLLKKGEKSLWIRDAVLRKLED